MHNYVSQEQGQAGLDDTVAKKSLSVYAYKTLYSRAAKFAKFRTSERQLDGSVIVWPAQKDKDTAAQKQTSGLRPDLLERNSKRKTELSVRKSEPRKTALMEEQEHIHSNTDGLKVNPKKV